MSASSPAHTAPTPYVLYLAMLSIGMGQTVIYAVMPALGRELGLDAIIVSIPLLAIDWQPGKLAITSLSAMTALVFALVAPFWAVGSPVHCNQALPRVEATWRQEAVWATP